MATNKFSSTFGTAFSVFKYVKTGNADLKVSALSVIGALVGSYFGARLALSLDEKYLKYLLVILLPFIAVFILTRKGFGEKESARELSNVRISLLSAASGLLIGAMTAFSVQGREPSSYWYLPE
jgi:uncharacterized membrane protein YfcA